MRRMRWDRCREWRRGRIPFNGTAAGMTSVTVRMRVRGSYGLRLRTSAGMGGRILGIRARVLYADSISPASVGMAGGTVTITGMGFRAGNAVTVNGVAATVTSWTATTIVAVAPASSALGVRRAGGGCCGEGSADGWEHGDDGSADVFGSAAECDDAGVVADGDGVCGGCCGDAVCGEGDWLRMG